MTSMEKLPGWTMCAVLAAGGLHMLTGCGTLDGIHRDFADTVLLYRFNEAGGIVHDASGNEYHATAGTNVARGVDGIAGGRAYNFAHAAGNNQARTGAIADRGAYLSPFNLNRYAQGFTLEAWIRNPRAMGTGGTRATIAELGVGTGRQADFFIDDGRLVFSSMVHAELTAASEALEWKTGVWYRVMVTIAIGASNATVTLYRGTQGVAAAREVARKSAAAWNGWGETALAGAYAMYIGSHDTPSRSLGGDMAEFRLTSRTPVTVPPKIALDHYIDLRGGLANCRLRFLRDRQARVAFIGGSITSMAGWRSLVCYELRKRFPNTDFDFINAGISSTDSSVGAFRLQRNVFGGGRVDLLFVEFAVNDEYNGRTELERVRGMEGIVRRARMLNPEIDIVMLYFADDKKQALFARGEESPVIASHRRVAEHYLVPTIDLAQDVHARVAAGEFTWGKFGGLHPAPFGHELYAMRIARLFDLCWPQPVRPSDRMRAHPRAPVPLDPFNYSGGELVAVKEAKLGKGWKLVERWRPADGAGTRDGFVDVPVLEATVPGATLTLRFTGRAIGIFFPAGPDVGAIEYVIDSGEPRRLDLFTEWSASIHVPRAAVFDAELSGGEHELTIRVAAEKNGRSAGHAARIVSFLVNRAGE